MTHASRKRCRVVEEIFDYFFIVVCHWFLTILLAANQCKVVQIAGVKGWCCCWWSSATARRGQFMFYYLWFLFFSAVFLLFSCIDIQTFLLAHHPIWMCILHYLISDPNNAKGFVADEGSPKKVLEGNVHGRQERV